MPHFLGKKFGLGLKLRDMS